MLDIWFRAEGVAAKLKRPKADGVAWPRIAVYNDHMIVSRFFPRTGIFKLWIISQSVSHLKWYQIDIMKGKEKTPLF